MFASLKSKIKEETGSDISKLTSSWRSGAFLGRITLRDDSSTTTSPSSSGGQGDTTSDSISPQLHTYLSERTAGEVDQAALQQQYVDQLEVKLKDRDLYWEQKIEELKLSLASVQGEEALAAQAVARTAQAEATQAITARDAAEKQLNELRARLAAAENAQDKLDALTEEVEQSRREWARERIELSAALGAADAHARDLADQLELLKAALPPENPHHHMHDDDKREVKPTGCDAFDRVCRERAVLSRQLQEAKVALADVKTSWSGQIATLETQEMTADFEKRIEDLTEENRGLAEALENERTLVKILREKVEKSHRLYDEQKAEVNQLNSVMTDMQHDYIDIQRKFDKEKREKDEALLRNAHMSQNVEMSQCNVRYLETEIVDLKAKITELEAVIAQHKENQAECMIIKENEAARTKEMEQLQRRIESFAETETALRKSIQDLETEICDKNKKIKTLDNRITDMKKTLQRELQTSKSDLSSAEEQDISRRYLKHVVLRFLTSRELEARQLTRALAVLLRLSAHEEALLRAALPARSGLSAWFPSLNT
ncbi:golgin subfamily A member 1-like isoform X3 [Maniola hyperantus]|uniref:golgin subfamily A member 1-like isoform X3 n=1 Tax=Aphantopus hyperantus TaxID=2795564 RepID=UPI0015681181|nr:golgin subfamily A member 1 isoform X3 [Maniola hyperantus]